MSDTEAVRYLDQHYLAQFGEASILNGMIEDRSRVYKRLYTVHAGMDDDADDAMYSELRGLDYQSEVLFCRHVADRLGKYLSTDSQKMDVTHHEVLVDVPRREIDSGGVVWVSPTTGPLVQLATLSDPIHSINSNYERLTKRARIFVSPRVAAVLGRNRRAEERAQLKTLLKDALEATRGKSQVQ